MAEHTPTPWTAYNQQVRDTSEHMVSIAYCSVIAGAGVCKDGEIRSFGIDESAALANAAFICKAVNNHDDLVKVLKKLSLAYVNLLETGRDRIISLGGSCDPVDVMESGDPSLRDVRAVLARVDVGGSGQ